MISTESVSFPSLYKIVEGDLDKRKHVSNPFNEVYLQFVCSNEFEAFHSNTIASANGSKYRQQDALRQTLQNQSNNVRMRVELITKQLDLLTKTSSKALEQTEYQDKSLPKEIQKQDKSNNKENCINPTEWNHLLRKVQVLNELVQNDPDQLLNDLPFEKWTCTGTIQLRSDEDLQQLALSKSNIYSREVCRIPTSTELQQQIFQQEIPDVELSFLKELEKTIKPFVLSDSEPSSESDEELNDQQEKELKPAKFGIKRKQDEIHGNSIQIVHPNTDDSPIQEPNTASGSKKSRVKVSSYKPLEIALPTQEECIREEQLPTFAAFTLEEAQAYYQEIKKIQIRTPKSVKAMAPIRLQRSKDRKMKTTVSLTPSNQFFEPIAPLLMHTPGIWKRNKQLDMSFLRPDWNINAFSLSYQNNYVSSECKNIDASTLADEKICDEAENTLCIPADPNLLRKQPTGTSMQSIMDWLEEEIQRTSTTTCVSYFTSYMEAAQHKVSRQRLFCALIFLVHKVSRTTSDQSKSGQTLQLSLQVLRGHELRISCFPKHN